MPAKPTPIISETTQPRIRLTFPQLIPTTIYMIKIINLEVRIRGGGERGCKILF